MKHYSFKSLIYTLISIFIFVSCQNEAIEIQKQVKITISPSKVLESFIPYKSSDLEMEVDEYGTARLRITALIYDSNGELYSQSIGLLKDYNSDYSFSVLLDPDEEYKLLAFSNSIMGTLDKITLEPYKINGINNLSTLEIVQTNEDSYYSNFSVLGILDDNLKSENDNMKFALRPATAYINLNWKNIHTLHKNESESIYGTYNAHAIDYFNKEYSWEITLTPGNGSNEVVINNFSAKLSKLGLTSDSGYNAYSGYIDGNKLIIPSGQDTNVVDDNIYSISLVGMNEETFEVEDIVISIDRENMVLTVENMWGTYSEKNDGGFYELFESGVEFLSPKGGSFEYDYYYIIYHNNDIMTYRNNDFVYSTSLDSTRHHGKYLAPSSNSASNNIYEICNLLPGTYDVFARSAIGNELKDYGRQSVTIKAGQQYIFKFDCASLELEISIGQLKSGAIWNSEMYEKQTPGRTKVLSFSNRHPDTLNLTKLEF